MDGILGFFGGIFKAIAGLLAIVVLIVGFVLGGKLGSGFSSDFSIGFALLGLLSGFIFDIFVFGFIGMIAEVNAKADYISSEVSTISNNVYNMHSIVSQNKTTYSDSYKSSDMLDRLSNSNNESTQFWTCKKCGCATNPMSSTTCKDCGEYK